MPRYGDALYSMGVTIKTYNAELFVLLYRRLPGMSALGPNGKCPYSASLTLDISLIHRKRKDIQITRACVAKEHIWV